MELHDKIVYVVYLLNKKKGKANKRQKIEHRHISVLTPHTLVILRIIRTKWPRRDMFHMKPATQSTQSVARNEVRDFVKKKTEFNNAIGAINYIWSQLLRPF